MGCWAHSTPELSGESPIPQENSVASKILCVSNTHSLLLRPSAILPISKSSSEQQKPRCERGLIKWEHFYD